MGLNIVVHKNLVADMKRGYLKSKIKKKYIQKNIYICEELLVTYCFFCDGIVQ